MVLLYLWMILPTVYRVFYGNEDYELYHILDRYVTLHCDYL